MSEYKTPEEILLKRFPNEGDIKAKPDYKDVVDAMQEYADRFKPKWIRVEERLPEGPIDLLLIDYNKDMCVGYWSTAKQHFCYTHNQEEIYNQITHLMPLPENP